MNIKDLTEEEINSLINIEKEKLDEINKELIDELNHLKELLQKIDK